MVPRALYDRQPGNVNVSSAFHEPYPSAPRYRHGEGRLRPLETVIWPGLSIVSDIIALNVTIAVVFTAIGRAVRQS